MALQSFIGPGPLHQFRIHFLHKPWISVQPVVRQLPTHRTTQHTDIHVFSEIQTHDPNVRVSEDSSCLIPRGHCYWLINRLKAWYLIYVPPTLTF
jgi:hypothetical protein